MSARRILILYNRVPYPLNDGGNIAVHAMIEGYRREGWQVYLLAMNTTRHRIADELLKDIYTDIYAFESVPVDNEVKPIDTIANYLFNSLPNHVVRFDIPAFAERLSEVLKRFQPHAVQAESVFLSSYLTLIRRQSNAVILLRMHNVEGQVWQRLAAETVNPFKRIYLSDLAKRINRYEQKAWALYDMLIPITEQDANAVKEILPGACMCTIPVGMEISNVAPSAGNEHWAGYHIGAMDWLPNREAVRWFIKEAWPVVRSKSPGFTFQYAGRNMSADMKMLQADGVLCVGEVSDAAAFIADKKILIVPLRSGGGIRVKILEAMMAGKLVISTSVGMQGIDAIPGTHYLQADTAEAFADAIAWALENKQQAGHIAEEASHFVRRKYDLLYLSRILSDAVSALLQTTDKS